MLPAVFYVFTENSGQSAELFLKLLGRLVRAVRRMDTHCPVGGTGTDQVLHGRQLRAGIAIEVRVISEQEKIPRIDVVKVAQLPDIEIGVVRIRQLAEDHCPTLAKPGKLQVHQIPNERGCSSE